MLLDVFGSKCQHVDLSQIRNQQSKSSKPSIQVPQTPCNNKNQKLQHKSSNKQSGESQSSKNKQIQVQQQNGYNIKQNKQEQEEHGQQGNYNFRKRKQPQVTKQESFKSEPSMSSSSLMIEESRLYKKSQDSDSDSQHTSDLSMPLQIVTSSKKPRVVQTQDTNKERKQQTTTVLQRKNSAKTPKGSVRCPVCNIAVTATFIQQHVNGCLAKQSGDTGLLSNQSNGRNGISNNSNRVGSSSNRVINSSGKGSNGMQQNGGWREKRNDLQVVAEKHKEVQIPPKLVFNMMNAKKIKTQLAKYELDTSGEKEELVNRYNAFRRHVTLAVDAHRNISIQGLAREFNNKQQNKDQNKIGQVDTVVHYSTNVPEPPLEGATNSYKELIKQAKQRQKMLREEKKQQQQQDQRTNTKDQGLNKRFEQNSQPELGGSIQHRQQPQDQKIIIDDKDTLKNGTDKRLDSNLNNFSELLSENESEKQQQNNNIKNDLPQQQDNGKNFQDTTLEKRRKNIKDSQNSSTIKSNPQQDTNRPQNDKYDQEVNDRNFENLLPEYDRYNYEDMIYDIPSTSEQNDMETQVKNISQQKNSLQKQEISNQQSSHLWSQLLSQQQQQSQNNHSIEATEVDDV